MMQKRWGHQPITSKAMLNYIASSTQQSNRPRPPESPRTRTTKVSRGKGSISSQNSRNNKAEYAYSNGRVRTSSFSKRKLSSTHASGGSIGSTTSRGSTKRKTGTLNWSRGIYAQTASSAAKQVITGKRMVSSRPLSALDRRRRSLAAGTSTSSADHSTSGVSTGRVSSNQRRSATPQPKRSSNNRPMTSSGNNNNNNNNNNSTAASDNDLAVGTAFQYARANHDPSVTASTTSAPVTSSTSQKQQFRKRGNGTKNGSSKSGGSNPPINPTGNAIEQQRHRSSSSGNIRTSANGTSNPQQIRRFLATPEPHSAPGHSQHVIAKRVSGAKSKSGEHVPMLRTNLSSNTNNTNTGRSSSSASASRSSPSTPSSSRKVTSLMANSNSNGNTTSRLSSTTTSTSNRFQNQNIPVSSNNRWTVASPQNSQHHSTISNNNNNANTNSSTNGASSSSSSSTTASSSMRATLINSQNAPNSRIIPRQQQQQQQRSQQVQQQQQNHQFTHHTYNNNNNQQQQQQQTSTTSSSNYRSGVSSSTIKKQQQQQQQSRVQDGNERRLSVKAMDSKKSAHHGTVTTHNTEIASDLRRNADTPSESTTTGTSSLDMTGNNNSTVNSTNNSSSTNFPVDQNGKRLVWADYAHGTSSKMEMYTLGKVLGEGSFGKVRLAWHSLTGEKVAIKCYEKSRIKSPNQWKRVEQEIRLMRKMDHNNIIRLLETVETPKRMNIVMECAVGGNLCSYVKYRRRLDANEARTIFVQIVNALDYLHSMNVIHRDVKLENILFDKHRCIKMVDFGFSVRNATKKLKIFCGTPSYMAPEIVMRKEYWGRPVDVWSLGVLLYAMLCGCFPFTAKSYPDLYRKIVRGQFTIPGEFSKSLKHLLQHMLCLDPFKRYSLAQIKRHPWTMEMDRMIPRCPYALSHNPADNIRQDVVEKVVAFDIPRQQLVQSLLQNNRDSMTSTYHLMLVKVKKDQRHRLQALQQAEAKSRQQQQQGISSQTQIQQQQIIPMGSSNNNNGKVNNDKNETNTQRQQQQQLNHNGAVNNNNNNNNNYHNNNPHTHTHGDENELKKIRFGQQQQQQQQQQKSENNKSSANSHAIQTQEMTLEQKQQRLHQVFGLTGLQSAAAGGNANVSNNTNNKNNKTLRSSSPQSRAVNPNTNTSANVPSPAVSSTLPNSTSTSASARNNSSQNKPHTIGAEQQLQGLIELMDQANVN